MCIELYAIMLKHKENQDLEKERLGEAYNHNDYVFTTMDGKMLNYRNVIRKFHQLLEKANIPKINFHSLRHLFASRLIQNNVSMKIVQEYLGHASYNLTANTYECVK